MLVCLAGYRRLFDGEENGRRELQSVGRSLEMTGGAGGIGRGPRSRLESMTPPKDLKNTLTALELGRAGTAVGVCVTVLWALGLDQSLDAVADPDSDLHGKALEASRRPTRAGKVRKASDDYDF